MAKMIWCMFFGHKKETKVEVEPTYTLSYTKCTTCGTLLNMEITGEELLK